MKDLESNLSPEQPQDNSRNPKEDIPLWLQGLEEETKANRIRAAREEDLSSANSEEQFANIPDDSPESGTVFDLPIEDTYGDEDEGDFLLIEEAPQPTDALETFPDSFETPETPSETIDDLTALENFEAEPIPEDKTLEGFTPVDIPEDVPESAEPLPDATESAEEEQLLPEALPQDLPDLSEAVGTSVNEINAEEPSEEEDETEKIAILSPDALDEEADQQEWVNEISEIETDLFNDEQDHTQPQKIQDIIPQNPESKPEEPASEPIVLSNEDLFVDISELNVDGSQDEPSPVIEEENNESDSGIIELIQESEDTPFTEKQILSDNGESTFIDGITPSNDEPFFFNDDEILPDDEALPKWLQRLIAESYPEDEITRDADFDEAAMNEITKPVQISFLQPLADDFEELDELVEMEEFEELDGLEELDESEETDGIEEITDQEISAMVEIPDEFEPDEEPFAEEEVVDQEDQDETAPDDFELEFINIEEEPSPPGEAVDAIEEITDIISDEDTQPVHPFEEPLEETPVVVEEPIEWSEEDNLYFNPQNGYLIEIPEPLQFARQVLKHGDILQALEIIKTYIPDDNFLDELKLWLLDAAESRLESQSDIWEAIGDIAARQDKHQEALAAYSKAINYLLSVKE
ncbi:MAG: hypothetical protein H0S79_01745 [Anaerolineaceae bacterium]|nr:hypothetical protein [Anaerolineaceae bacterium]